MEKLSQTRAPDPKRVTAPVCPRCGAGELHVETVKNSPSRVDPGVTLRYRYRRCTNVRCGYRPPPTQERIGP